MQKTLVLSYEDAQVLVDLEKVLEQFEVSEEVMLDGFGDLNPDEPLDIAEAKLRRWKIILASARNFVGVPGGGRHSGE
jgi:hypothetical protein